MNANLISPYHISIYFISFPSDINLFVQPNFVKLLGDPHPPQTKKKNNNNHNNHNHNNHNNNNNNNNPSPKSHRLVVCGLEA